MFIFSSVLNTFEKLKNNFLVPSTRIMKANYVSSEREAIIARALETPEGRLALANAMIEPIRRNLEYQPIDTLHNRIEGGLAFNRWRMGNKKCDPPETLPSNIILSRYE